MAAQEFAVVILAGGLGSVGLYPLAEHRPKALLPIANRPLISYQLELFEAAGFKDVTVLTYEAAAPPVTQYVKGYKGRLKIDLVVIPEELETADALYRLKDRMPRSDFIVCSGDLIVDGKFLPLMADVHRSQDALVTTLIKETPREEPQPGKKPAKEEVGTRDCIALDASKKRLLFLSNSSAAELESELTIPKQLLRAFPNLTIYNNLMDAHCYFFSHKVWAHMDERRQTRKKLYAIKGELLPSLIRHQYRPADKPAAAPLALDTSVEHAPAPTDSGLQLAYRMSASGAREERKDAVRCLVYLLEADRLCMRVNTLSAYAELNRLVASGATPFRPNEPPSKDGKSFVNEKAEVAQGAQISAGCVIGQSKIGEGTALKVSVVGDRCVIGRNVKITNSVIMDDVVIADNCTITSSILCANVELREKCVIKDSALGVGFDCPAGTEIKNQKVSQEAE